MKMNKNGLNEQGITLQTIIILSILALAAVGAGIVVFNSISDESGEVDEASEAVERYCEEQGVYIPFVEDCSDLAGPGEGDDGGDNGGDALPPEDDGDDGEDGGDDGDTTTPPTDCTEDSVPTLGDGVGERFSDIGGFWVSTNYYNWDWTYQATFTGVSGISTNTQLGDYEPDFTLRDVGLPEHFNQRAGTGHRFDRQLLEVDECTREKLANGELTLTFAITNLEGTPSQISLSYEPGPDHVVRMEIAPREQPRHAYQAINFWYSFTYTATLRDADSGEVEDTASDNFNYHTRIAEETPTEIIKRYITAQGQPGVFINGETFTIDQLKEEFVEFNVDELLPPHLAIRYDVAFGNIRFLPESERFTGQAVQNDGSITFNVFDQRASECTDGFGQPLLINDCAPVADDTCLDHSEFPDEFSCSTPSFVINVSIVDLEMNLAFKGVGAIRLFYIGNASLQIGDLQVNHPEIRARTNDLIASYAALGLPSYFWALNARGEAGIVGLTRVADQSDQSFILYWHGTPFTRTGAFPARGTPGWIEVIVKNDDDRLDPDYTYSVTLITEIELQLATGRRIRLNTTTHKIEYLGREAGTAANPIDLELYPSEGLESARSIDFFSAGDRPVNPNYVAAERGYIGQHPEIVFHWHRGSADANPSVPRAVSGELLKEISAHHFINGVEDVYGNPGGAYDSFHASYNKYFPKRISDITRPSTYFFPRDWDDSYYFRFTPSNISDNITVDVDPSAQIMSVKLKNPSDNDDPDSVTYEFDLTVELVLDDFANTVLSSNTTTIRYNP